jgi:hypothetical protein
MTLGVPGVPVAATAGGLRLLSVDSITQMGPTSSGRRVVLASARVRDLQSRASYELRYRVLLVRRDRWYVASVDRGGR